MNMAQLFFFVCLFIIKSVQIRRKTHVQQENCCNDVSCADIKQQNMNKVHTKHQEFIN